MMNNDIMFPETSIKSLYAYFCRATKTKPIFFTTNNAKVKVTAIDTYSALVEPVAANAGAITITATAQAGQTATATFKAVV